MARETIRERRERRQRLAATARRAQLVDVGRSVFAESGYEATTVEQIAERAGISKPIVYEHFGGKEGLHSAVVEREIEDVVGRIAARIGSGSPRERFENAAVAFLTYVEERPDGFAVLLRDAPSARSGSGLPALMFEFADRVSVILAEQFRAAGYDARTAPIYAHALVGMVAFVGHWWTEKRKPSVDAVASHVTALGWMGLRHLPRRPAPVKRSPRPRKAGPPPTRSRG